MINTTKYPKSKYGFQCLTNCYKPGTKILHPITYEYVSNISNPFCAVSEWTYVDENNKKNSYLTDICYHTPINNTDISNSELEMNMLIPQVDFNIEHFLKIFYNIFSFEDGITWIDKYNFKPFNTKLRIFNMCIITFGYKLDIIDNRVVDIFIEIIKKKYINKIIINLDKYIDNKSNNKEQYILTNFINDDILFKFLSRYIKHNKNNSNTEVWLLDNIINSLIEYLDKKITNKKIKN